MNTAKLIEETKELFNQQKFEEIIELLTNDTLRKIHKKEKNKIAELYIFRGNAWYNKKEYDKAISDYNNAKEIVPNYDLAFYNMGNALVAKKEYDKAIENYNTVIEHNPDYIDVCYTARGNVRKAKKEYKEAIDDYTKAIDSCKTNSDLDFNLDLANAYYNRGLAKKEGNIELKGSKQDFEKYLELTAGKDEIWDKYARDYIEDLKRINDKELSVIVDLIASIKDVLLINEEYITHYTSLSVLKSLILDCNKFRISEGNFMNDPSEGREFFKFLGYTPSASCKNGCFSESFLPKPFIGSFVTKDKQNDLNMWRFYGKERGEEANGCAITLQIQKFTENIKSFLSNEENKDARLDDESDINFYRVVYVDGATKFYIPNSDDSKKLEKLMKNLRTKVNSYQGNNKIYLEKYLNNIAFLFKSDAYKNENEVRLIVKGIEFEKQYNMDINPPRVYIELVSIKNIVSQITLGPNVGKISEWGSVFHYRYKRNVPEIIISHLPYK